MADLSSLTPITTAANGLSNLILATPKKTVGYQPQNPAPQNGQTTKQPSPIVFHYEQENTATLQSDITDHYVEDNTAVQDQIALRPEKITSHGIIGELNDIAPKALQPLKALADKLTIISAYAPALSVTAILAYDAAAFLYATGLNVANAAVQSWSSLNGSSNAGESVIDGNSLTTSPNQSKQQIIFQQLYGYWRNRTLFTIQTPWAIFQNMAIENMRAVQPEDSELFSEFEITWKIIRTASTTSVAFTIGSELQGRAAIQAGETVDLGTSAATPSDSLATGLDNNFPGVLSA